MLLVLHPLELLIISRELETFLLLFESTSSLHIYSVTKLGAHNYSASERESVRDFYLHFQIQTKLFLLRELRHANVMRDKVAGLFVHVRVCFSCRRFSDPVHDHVDPRGHSAVPHRAWHGPADAVGRTRRVEHHPPLARRHRHLVLHRDAVRRHLLQCHHHLVHLLLCK
jgi:hypothetical protein